MWMMTMEEFLARADAALRDRVPAADLLELRTQMDNWRGELREQLRLEGEAVEAFGDELLRMDRAFARVHWNRTMREDRMLCLLMIARYVFRRERAARSGRQPPAAGGSTDEALGESCLLGLLRGAPARHLGVAKTAVNGRFGGGGLLRQNGR